MLFKVDLFNSNMLMNQFKLLILSKKISPLKQQLSFNKLLEIY